MISYYENLIKNHDTTYKLFLLKYLFNSISEGKRNFTFKELSCGILSEAWEILNEKACRLLPHDRLFDLFIYVLRLNEGIENYSDKKDVFDYLTLSNDKYITKKLREFVLYAPYRLICIDKISNLLRGEKDSRKNKIIEDFSKIDENLMYVIESKNVYIKDYFYEEIRQHYSILYNWINKVIKTEIGGIK